MRKKRFLQEEKRNKIFEKSGVNSISGTIFISVDIQPEYESAFGFDIYSYTQFINENIDTINKCVFLYNGADTLGMISESEYKWWLVENGLEEENLNYISFYDKGYAFFRYCMDEGIDDDEIVDLVKYMMNHDINDSRDIDEEMWQGYMEEYNYDQSDVKELLEYADDMINIPDLMGFLRKYNGRLILTGGGVQECLKEVEIALMALNKQYNLYTKFTY